MTTLLDIGALFAILVPRGGAMIEVHFYPGTREEIAREELELAGAITLERINGKIYQWRIRVGSDETQAMEFLRARLHTTHVFRVKLPTEAHD